jgi:Cdc6-like AAA superfamily ATPase
LYYNTFLDYNTGLYGGGITMPDDFVSIWEIYGLNTDPFSTSPILVKGGLVSAKSFTGRQDELERLEKSFRSAGGSRTIVFGMQGVGKTTLVNVARMRALESEFFTPFQEIKADANWETTEFILNTISAIYSSLIKLKKPKKGISAIIEKLKPVFDSYERVDRNYALPVVGGGYGTTRVINRPEINTNFLTNLFEEVVDSLLKSGYREVIVHYNNLDNFDEEEEKIKRLFNNARDFIQTPHVHFVFVGSPTTAATINSIPRVSNILTDTPIQIEPLSLADIKKIIHGRVKFVAITDMNFVDPVTDEAIETLYGLHTGNIRAILNSLSTAIRDITEEKPILLTNELLKKVLYKIAQKRFADKITPMMQSVLMEMLSQGESNNKAISDKMGKKNQNVSKYLSALKENQCIYLVRTDGREKYYSVAEWVKWLLLDPDKKYQSQITQF